MRNFSKKNYSFILINPYLNLIKMELRHKGSSLLAVNQRETLTVLGHSSN